MNKRNCPSKRLPTSGSLHQFNTSNLAITRNDFRAQRSIATEPRTYSG